MAKRKGAGRPTLASQKKRRKDFEEGLLVAFPEVVEKHKNRKDQLEAARHLFLAEAYHDKGTRQWIMKQWYGEVTNEIEVKGSIDIPNINEIFKYGTQEESEDESESDHH